MSDVFQTPPIRTFGFWAVLVGGLAIVMVFAPIAIQATQPQPSIGTQIGEIAGDIRRSAWRSFLGLEQPTPEPSTSATIMTTLMMFAAPVLGGVAVALAGLAASLGEHRRLAAYGAMLGFLAILFFFAFWIAMIILAMCLLIAILQNMDGIFGFDLFGG